MIKIKAFRGIRPSTAELAAQVASKPYDVMNRSEAKAMSADNPNSFLHIIRAEANLPDELSPYDSSVYEKSKSTFEDFVARNVLQQDETDCLYIYAQTMNGQQQIGLACGVSIEDYQNDRIKKHEYTRPAKEQDRITHINTTSVQTGPVLMAYPQVLDIDAVVAEVTAKKADYDFVADDEVRHTFWVVKDADMIQSLVDLFAQKVPAIYIADGHHRAASSTKVGLERAENNPNHDGTEEYNFFLAVLFPDNQLNIIDYNRVVTDLNGLDKSTFLEKVEKDFEVEEWTKGGFCKPEVSKEFGLYIDKTWYKLTAKTHTHRSDDPIKSLDITILSDYLLDPILGIKDQRKDDRIDFVGGIRGLEELERRVDSGEMALAVAIFPVSIGQLIDVADSGQVMPPKSTWFEPKLRSGLLSHRF